MIELIITILINLGFNFNSTNNITINNDAANQIRSDIKFESLGGEQELSRCVTISNSNLDEIVITDDDNPRN